MLAGTLEIEMLANMARLSRDMDEAKRSVGGAMASIEKSVAMAKTALGALGLGLSVGALIQHARATIDAADAMNDMSQQVGIAVKDLAKYELAASQSGTTMEAIAKGIKGLSGNLMEHGAALKKAGIDATTADGAMQQLADVFAAMPDGMEKTTLAVKMFGKSGMELIPMLNLGSQGLQDAAEKSAKYAEQMAAMAPMADAFNDSMGEIAMHSKVAGMAMVNDMLPALVEISKAMADAAQKGGVFAGVMAGLDTLGNKLFDWEGNAQRKIISNLTEDLADLHDQQNAITLDIFGNKGQIQSEIDAKIKALADAKAAYFKFSDGNAGRGNVNPSSVRPAVDWLAEYKAYMAALGGNSDAKKATAEANKEFAAQAAILSELSGYTKDYESTIQRYATMRDKGTLSEEAFTRAVQELVQLQPGYVASLKTQTEAQKLLDKAVEDTAKQWASYQDQQTKSIIAADDEVTKAQASYDAHGKLASVLQEEAVARLEVARAQIIGTEDTAVLDAQIKAKRELINILRNGEARDAVDDLEKANKKAAEESSKYWEDALMRAFESGKGFFESLWDTIKNTLKTQVLKVLVTGVIGGVSGLASAATGTSALTSASSGLSLASGASSLYSSMVGPTMSGLASGATSLGGILTATGSEVAAAYTYGTAIGSAQTAALAASEVGMGAAGGAGSAVGAIPVWGWIAAGVLALYAAIGGGETRAGATYTTGADGKATKSEGPSGGEIAGDVSRAIFNSTQSGINETLKSVGSAAAITGFTAGLESSENGKGFAFAGGMIDGVGVGEYKGRNGGQFAMSDMTPKQALEAYVVQMNQVTLEALQAATDVPTLIADQLRGVDISKLTADGVNELTATVKAVIASVNTLRGSLLMLPMDYLHEITFAAAASLVTFSGGMEQFNTNLSGYYDNFYSAAEKNANLTRVVTDALKAQNIVLPAVDGNLKEWYRAEIERLGAMDLGVEANANAYASVLALQGGVNTLATSFDTAADAAEKLAETNQGWQDQLDVLNGKTTEREIALRDTTEATTRALMRQVYAQQDLAAASESAAAAAQALAATNQGWKDQLDVLTGATTNRDIALRDAGDDSTRALMRQVYAQEDLKAAADMASQALQQAAQSAAQAASAIASERAGLTRQLLTEQGDTKALRAFDLEAIDPSNRALQEEIWRLADANKAAAAAANAAASAAQSLRSAWSSLTDSLFGEVQRIRGLISGDSGMGYATAQTQFAITTAQARAGSEEAVKLLPGLSQTLLTLAEANATTLVELQRIRAQTAGSLQSTGATLAGRYGIAMPSFDVGTNYVPADGPAYLHQGEAVVPKAYNPAAGGQNNEALVAEIRALRQEVQGLRAEAQATAQNTYRTQKLLDRAMPDGDALATRVAA